MEGANHKRPRCVIELEFGSEASARAVFEATNVDNDDFVQARLEGNKLIAEMEGGSLDSLRRTLDDYLACLNAAEKTANLTAEKDD